MAKENDLLLNQLQNPAFNAYDFKQVGLDINNTSLEDKETYRNLDFVRNNPLLQTDGVFDEAKFDALYTTALSRYNQMAQNKVGEDIGAHAEFFRDNIYAPIESRSNKLNYEIYRVANPLRTQKSISRIDAITESPLSVREIAQTQRVWDDKTKTWQDAPNDSLLANWTHTRVMAQWDEEGDHIDPVTGELVHHQKGDKKLNDAGTYYYENLNGRSVYGREVLSKFDTLTTDGSAWNKFDFFDSDDKKKSLGGTLVKNAIKVIPALIPVTSPWYIGMRVGVNTIGLLGTLGNMFTGNSVSLFHGMEGFAQSMKSSQSDWVTGGVAGTEAVGTKGHAWSLESMLGIAGDVFTQLAEQRWLFQYPIRALKGAEATNLMYDDAARAAFVNSKHAERLKALESLGGLSEAELATAAYTGKAGAAATQTAAAFQWAKNQLQARIDDYQKIGKYISMAYMTGVTVQDSYGEALQEGASPVEAALLTLGYAIGEYGIINSDLGKWILPELKETGARWQQIGKVLAAEGLSEDVLKSTDKVAKSNFISRVVHLGKQHALYDYMRAAGKNDFTQAAKMTAKAAFANALGEGVEETSEELLYDFSKTLFNIGASLTGSGTRLSTFDGGDLGAVFNRYALSFVGGTIGGGLGELLPNFRQASSLHKMTQEQAYEELVQIVKEGKADKFLDTVDRLTWAPTDVSFDMDESGNYKPTKRGSEDSQDATIKKMLRQEIDTISRMLKVEGADLENEEVLRRISGANDPKLELRALALGQSKVASKYLEQYNQLLSDLIKDKIELQSKYTVNTDSAEKKAEEEAKNEEAIAELKARIALEEKELQSYLKGEKVADFTGKALFEMSKPISEGYQKNLTFTSYVEDKYHKKIDEISDADLATARDEFVKISDMEGADLILHVYDKFIQDDIKFAPALQSYVTTYMDRNSTIGRFEDLTTKFMEADLMNPNDEKVLQNAAGRYAADTPAFDFVRDPMTHFVDGLITHLKDDGYDVSSYIARFNAIINDLNSGAITNLEASHQLAELIYQDGEDGGTGLLGDAELQKAFVDEIRYAPYISQTTRDDLAVIIGRVYDRYEDAIPELDEVTEALRDNPNRGPILEILDSFSLATKGTEGAVKISELLTGLEALARSTGAGGSLDNFGFDSDIEEKISDALKIVRMAKAQIAAARTDKSKIGDAWGYNKSVNELNPEMHLAEIDSNTADVIMQELDGVAIRLSYYKNIADIISGNKLREHAQTGVKTSVLLYDTIMRRFVEPTDFPPDDWDRDSINELKAELSSPDIILLKKLQGEFAADPAKMTLNLNPEEAVTLQAEIRKVENALSKFFKANESNINDVEKLAKFLDISRWGTDVLDSSILTKGSDSLSSISTVWWLAAIASGEPDAFYSNYKKIFNADEGIAPVAGQEIAVRVAVAALTNGKVFAQFAKAQNLALQRYAETHGDDPNIARKFYIDGKKENGIDLARIADSDVSVDFLRTILIEGIAGSGKSTGVARQIIKMLASSDATKGLLENVWITHTTKEKAYKLATELFGKEIADALKEKGNIVSHEGLMQTISGTNSSGHKWHETYNERGELVIPSEDILFEEGKAAKYNYGVNKAAGDPTLIITDEVSHLSLPSLQLIEEFADVKGIHHLAFGDFDQSGVTATIKDATIVDSKGNPVLDSEGNPRKIGTYQAYAYNTNFIHPFKLGQSLRTDNKLKDRNNALLRQMVVRVKDPNFDVTGTIPDEEKISLQYAESPDSGVLGDKIIRTPKDDAGFNLFKASIKDLLDRTKATDKDAKLGYIYDPEYDSEGKEVKSKITEILEEFNASEEYKGMVDFKHGDAAQGDENPYYVINLTSLRNDKVVPAVEALYTGITRAKKASLILESDFTRRFIKQGPSDLVKSVPKFNITGTAIKEFVEKKRKVYDDVYTEDVPLTYSKYATANTESKPTAPVAVEDVSVPSGYYGKGVILKDGDGNKWRVVQYNKDEKGVYSVILENVETGAKTTQSLDDLSHLTPAGEEVPQGDASENKHLSKPGDIDNSDPEVVQMEHHTFNMDELGLEEDGDSYKFGVNADNRFDNVIGVIKTLATLGHTKAKSIDFTQPIKKTDAFLQQVIIATRKIRSLGRYAKSEAEIQSTLNTILAPFGVSFTDKVHARFAYKVSQDFNHDGSGTNPKFTRSSKEAVSHLISDTGPVDQSDLIDNMIVMVLINDSGKELLEVPICCDTNPITLALTQGFGYDDASKQDITAWVTKRRAEILKSSESNKYIKLLTELEAALRNPAELGRHPQAKKLLGQIELFTSNQKPMSGKIQFLTTEIGGKTEWLLPGRDWEHSGVIVNTKENISVLDEGMKYAHYGEEWLSYKSLKARGTMQMSSRVYMAQSEMKITKAGRTITIDPGKPFIIVSDNLNISFTGEQDFMDALVNPDDVSTTFVYVEPMVASVKDFITQLNSKYGNDDSFIYTDIGNYNTSYRVLKEVLKTKEGEAWLLQRFKELYPGAKEPTSPKEHDRRPESLLADLKSIIQRFEKVEEEAEKTGKENELILGLRTTLEQDGKVGNPPLIAYIGAYVMPGVTYGHILDRTLRALTLGYPSADSRGISFRAVNDTEVIGDSGTIKKLETLITVSEDSVFKHGIYRHVEYAKGTEFRHAVGENALIEVASKTNISTPLDPEKEGIKVDGKLDTGVLKTATKEQSDNYQKQRIALAGIKSDIEQESTARGDSYAYKSGNLSRFTADSPDEIGKPKKPTVPPVKPTKRDTILKIVNDYKTAMSTKDIHSSAAALELLTRRLDTFKLSELTPDKALVVIDSLYKSGDILIFQDQNNPNTSEFDYTREEVLEQLKSSGYEVTSLTSSNGGYQIESGGKKYDLHLGISGSAAILQLTEVQTPKAPKTPKTTTVVDSVSIQSVDGKTTTLKDADSVEKLLLPELVSDMKTFPREKTLESDPNALLGIESLFMSLVDPNSVHLIVAELRNVLPVDYFTNGGEITAAYILAGANVIAKYVDKGKLNTQLRNFEAAMKHPKMSEKLRDRWRLIGAIVNSVNALSQTFNQDADEDSDENLCSTPIRIAFHF